MDSESDAQKRLRASIQEVQRDSTLDAATKAQKIKALMLSAHKIAPKEEKTEEEVPQDLDKSITYHKVGILGCQHYRRSCKILAACCKQLFTCRLCHDEKVKEHQIDRHATTQVFCMKCSTLQDVVPNCEKCGECFAKYFCKLCKFYDDDPQKNIFHCNECGICRIGTPETVFHCKECGVCMAVENRVHRHIPNNLASACPICHEILWSSRSATRYLPCHHPIHYDCFYELVRQGGFACPTCKRSVGDLSATWRQMDRMIAAMKMPDIFSNAKVLILCNDCGTKSTVQFHYVGAKCSNPQCGSYNTVDESHIDFPSREAILEHDTQMLRAQLENNNASGENDDNNDQIADNGNPTSYDFLTLDQINEMIHEGPTDALSDLSSPGELGSDDELEPEPQRD